MTQEVDGVRLQEVNITRLQGTLGVSEKLEHTAAAHTDLSVVKRVEADLKLR